MVVLTDHSDTLEVLPLTLTDYRIESTEGTSTDLSIKQEDGAVVITTDRPDALSVSTTSEIEYNVVDSGLTEGEEEEDPPEDTEDPTATEAPSESSDSADLLADPDGTESDGTAETAGPEVGEETGSSEEASDGGEAAQPEPAPEP